MVNNPISSRTLTLPSIHVHWIASLDKPPTTSLAPLRCLINAITKHGGRHGARHGESTLIPRQHFAPLFLDLSLTYAYLGDYWLAITAVESAVALNPTFALGWFAKGLCRAELGEWRRARRAFKECLKCFEAEGKRLEKIPYKIDELGSVIGTGLGEEWVLEWSKVEWNYKVALLEGGSRTNPQSPKPELQQRQGLNGIPAGVHLGPGWNRKLEAFDIADFEVVASASYVPSLSSSNEDGGKDTNDETYGSWNSDSTFVNYDTKPLPPLPKSSRAPFLPASPTIPKETLPTIRVFSYYAAPNDFKCPQFSGSSSESIPRPKPKRAQHLAKEIWMPLMPPRVTLDSPMAPYFPDQTKREGLEHEVWWQGNQRCSVPLNHRRRQSSINDVIDEWIADSDDIDVRLDQTMEGMYPVNEAGNAEVGGEGIILDDNSDTLKSRCCSDSVENSCDGWVNTAWNGDKKEWNAANLPTPIAKCLEKGKEREMVTDLCRPIGKHRQDVNEKGEQILLPKAFEGFPEDVEQRMRDWKAKWGAFPGNNFL